MLFPYLMHVAIFWRAWRQQQCWARDDRGTTLSATA